MRICFGALVLVLVGVVPVPAQEPIGVCDVLKEMPAHTGQIVKVRGIYFATREGVGISDRACEQQVNAHDQKWVAAIWLWNEGEQARFSAKIERDEASYQRLIRLSTDARARGKVVRAVLEGRLEYCPVKAETQSGQLGGLGVAIWACTRSS